MEDISVKIFGNQYNLKSNSINNLKIVALSDRLNHLMHEQAGKLNNISPLKVAVLTALNLLEELQSMKEESIS